VPEYFHCPLLRDENNVRHPPTVHGSSSFTPLCHISVSFGMLRGRLLSVAARKAQREAAEGKNRGAENPSSPLRFIRFVFF
jgi:hypothetical protein